MIPTFNQAQYLEEAVASALAQDYPALEVVIADDASTDDTPAVLERFAADPRVRVHRQASNIGRVANYRYLLERLATGEWVLNLDGDDCLVSREYLRKAMALALENPGVLLVIGKALSGASLAEATTVLNAPFQDAAMPPAMSGCTFLQRFPPFETIVPLHATCLYHRPSALAIGFYRHDILSTDFESFYRLMLDGKVGFVHDIAALWRQHDANATRAPGIDALARNVAVFDGPAQRAAQTGCLDEARAERWRRGCRARYVVSLVAQAVGGRLPAAPVARLCLSLLGRDWRLAAAIGPALARAYRDRGRRMQSSNES